MLNLPMDHIGLHCTLFLKTFQSTSKLADCYFIKFGDLKISDFIL